MPTDRVTIETKPLIALKDFFNVGTTHVVSMNEMGDFWKANSEEEKAVLKEQIKKWDGESYFVK